MSIEALKGRLERLEKIVDELVRQRSPTGSDQKNWRSTIGMFKDDPIMKEVIDGALQAREQERRQFYEEYDKQVGNTDHRHD